ncbi:Cholesteryl ester transfer protein [Lamellibrachia satsuma]|nr:Cholesteryl ester transfer protein [Lamellibrachia satsuma]
MCGASTNPGLQIRFSRRGLGVVFNAALNVMASKVAGKTIDDHHGRSGKKKYDVTGMRITSFDKPSTTTTVAPGSGITWKLSGGAISIKGDWHYKYRQNWLLQASDSGSFDLSVSGLDLRISIMLGMDNSGQPTIRTTGCSSDVGRVHVHLHGGASWLYNLFDHKIGNVVKSKLKDKLCDAAKKSIDVNGAKRIKTLNLQVMFAKLLMLDYRLVAPPKFTNDYVESKHKGEVFEQNVMTEAPFQPPPLPDQTWGGTRMMTFWASEYVLNTLGYLLQKYGLLQYNLLDKDLAEIGRPCLLNTTCPGSVCIGNIIPGLSKHFPNSSVMIHLVSTGETDQPRFTMLPGDMQGHLAAMAYYSVKTNTTDVHLFKAKINLTIKMDVRMTEHRVKSRVSKFSMKMTFVHTNYKVATEKQLEAFFGLIVDIWIRPKLNDLGDIGFLVPSFKDVRFVNPDIKIVKGALQLGVDFKYDSSLSD